MCAVLAGTAVLFIGLGREQANDDFDKAFWVNKYTWSRNADVVLAGDSQVLHGVTPEALAEEMGQGRVLNYAFRGLGYDQEYLQAVDRIIDYQSSRPTVVLGISPYSLTRNAQNHNQFKSRALFEGKTLSARLPAWSRGFYRRIRPVTACRERLAGMTMNYKEVYYPNGWIAADYEGPVVSDVDRYRLLFLDNPVDSDVMESLFRQVEQWRKRGVRVYGFHPPSSREMAMVEKTLSGFQESDFKRRFQAAGGCWLEVPLFGYDSYDNRHLTRQGALAFTRDLAQHIKVAPVQLSQEMTVSEQ